MRQHRKLIAIYAVAGLIVLVGSLAAWGLLRLRTESEWVLHTRDVLAAVDAVVANLASAESALRAYQATGDPGYLVLLEGAPAAIEAQLERLDELTSREPDQAPRVDALTSAARSRLASIHEASLADPAENPEPRVRSGTLQMARVRAAAHTVREGQEAQLRTHVERERSIAVQLLAIILIGSLASGLLVAVLARAVRGDFLRQERAARQLERQAEELRSSAARLQAANAELHQLRNQAEAARSASERAAREESRARAVQNRFMAMTTHEIRQPINALLGFGQLLELEVTGPLSDGQKAQVRRIVAGAQHLRMLVDDFLDLAKAEAGQLVVDVVRAPVAEVLHSAVELVTPQASTRDIHIDVLDTTDCGSYQGDPMRVRQVLVNLLSNAIKFTPSGGTLRLRCSSGEIPDSLPPRREPGEWIRFAVTDSGPGIPEERVKAVFEPFVQNDDGGAGQAGTTGLGLTVSRTLARLMGGDLTVSSTPGKGSTFSLWLFRPYAVTGASANGGPPPGPEGGADVSAGPAVE